MRLIDADALREQWNVSERCEDCKQDARYCDGNLYGSTLYSLRDICGSIDDAPIIDAIPVEWLEEHDSEGNEYGRRYITVVEALSMWQKEQEASM